MLTTLRRVLSFEMTVAEWIGTAAMLAVPYLAIGVLWALVNSGGIAAIVWWPAQVVSTACLA
ncbi:hypothetical protein Mycsm_01412 [Mycobacterium sp. JS623]|uniref:hypothetical protein n=1 Tax=Mycobacterium sp. JS623 TaxID=212767 RepID=UPI0002A5777F|nr:hypothetical protein [Mycobacterium sp. JS623]AGB21824.1 hypothetical protein Mycsm_01412 [Mycobacterium sp. JS623]